MLPIGSYFFQLPRNSFFRFHHYSRLAFIDGTKKNSIDLVITELRRLNKLQREKITMQKNFMEYQKVMMEQTLDMQRDMVKTQMLLADSVKSFVDNIAFNS